MDVGQPDPKRSRILPPGPPSQWHTANNAPPLDTSRHLPPPPAQYQQPSYPRPPELPPSRRHSGHNDPPHYDPQDPRRPHSRSSHGYHPPPPPHTGPPPAFNGHRESISREHPAQGQMIKRDPSEEVSYTQFGRSPNNSNDHNVNQYQQHPSLDPGRPYHHQQQPPQGHPQYDPAQTPQPRTNSYPQSPMGAPEQYGPPYQRPPTHTEQYSSVAYPQASTPRANEVKRKAQRAAQACDSCRTLKAKCDEGRPTCGTCKEKEVTCNYRDPPPKQPEKGSADVLDSLARLTNILEAVREETSRRLSTIERQIANTDRANQAILDSSRKPSNFYGQDSREPLANAPPTPYTRVAMDADGPHLQRDPSGYTPTLTPVQQPDEIVNPAILEEPSEEDEGGELRAPKKSTIPVNHTTGAARLLTAPGIRELVQDVIGPGKAIPNERYPMIQEEKRGSLRLFGRGEGTEYTPGYERSAVDHVSEGTPGDAHSETSSPAPQGEDFGQVGGLTPPTHPPASDFVRGGISSDGMPDLSQDTIWELVRSYKENINIIHPILAPRQLDRMVEMFIRELPENQARPRQITSMFVGGRLTDSPGNKRKRSPGLGEHHETPPTSHNWDARKSNHPLRTITHAIVLLVLALGKICLHKGKIPDISRETLMSTNSPLVKNGFPFSPVQQSPSMQPIPSPAEMPARSRRTSMENALVSSRDRAKPKNIDLIPGLAYFAFATDILGNQMAGNRLQHVHGNILACLYHGQLGRVLESHAYIHQACYSLEGILRKRFDRLKGHKDNGQLISAKDNPLVFAFWTCLQLESDIIAELPVPQSNILTYEEDMPSPNLKAAAEQDGFDELVLGSYSAQLYLRKHLNNIHNMFYNPNEEQEKYLQTNTIDILENTALGLLAPTMTWNTETGERSSHILHARLRAKYYGASVITYRPFLLQILEVTRPRSVNYLKSINGVEKDWKPGVGAPPVNRNATSIQDIDPRAIAYAKKGIIALIYSTSALHDVVDCGKQRLLVTNVWGTAHAQWGNLMTLQACFKDVILSPIVREVITEEQLSDLLQKTVSFLNFIATRTGGIAIDLFLLRHVGEKLGLLPNSKQGSIGMSGNGSGNGSTGSGGYRAVDSNGGSFTSIGSGPGGQEVSMTGYQS